MLIHKYIELKRKILDLEEDVEKLHYKSNYSAGTRIRKELQEIREMCTDFRALIQNKRHWVAKQKKLKKHGKQSKK